MTYNLAIEASTPTPTAALLRNDTPLDSVQWEASRGAAQRMFGALRAMLKTHNVALDNITTFSTGLGPGRFTGLRTAVAAIRALAQPSHTPVVGVSSAAAIAMQVQEDWNRNPGRIVVVGDARRNRLWVGTFTSTTTPPQQADDFALIPIADFAQQLCDNDVVVSPDWQRLRNTLPGVIPKTITYIENDIRPTATHVARLARLKAANGIIHAQIEPIYIHPPVFVEPRFTKSTTHHP